MSAILRPFAIASDGLPARLLGLVTGGPGKTEGPVRHEGLPQTCIKVFGRMGGA